MTGTELQNRLADMSAEDRDKTLVVTADGVEAEITDFVVTGEKINIIAF